MTCQRSVAKADPQRASAALASPNERTARPPRRSKRTPANGWNAAASSRAMPNLASNRTASSPADRKTSRENARFFLLSLYGLSYGGTAPIPIVPAAQKTIMDFYTLT